MGTLNEFFSEGVYYSNPTIDNYFKRLDDLFLDFEKNRTNEKYWVKKYDLIFYVCYKTFIERRMLCFDSIKEVLLIGLCEVIREVDTNDSYSDHFKYVISFSLVTSGLYRFISDAVLIEKLKSWADLCFNKNRKNKFYKLNRIMFDSHKIKRIKKLIKYFAPENGVEWYEDEQMKEAVFINYFIGQFLFSYYNIFVEIIDSSIGQYWSVKRDLLIDYISYREFNAHSQLD